MAILGFVATGMLATHAVQADPHTAAKSGKKRSIASERQDTWVCRIEYTTVGNALYAAFTNISTRTLSK
jgi:hypothetical protein